MDYRLIFKHQLTKKVSVFRRTDESATKSFYRFELPMGLDKGEYEYYVVSASGELVLNENDIRLSTIDGEKINIYDNGLAQVGKVEQARKQTTSTYENTKTYKQYYG